MQTTLKSTLNGLHLVESRPRRANQVVLILILLLLSPLVYGQRVGLQPSSKKKPRINHKTVGQSTVQEDKRKVEVQVVQSVVHTQEYEELRKSYEELNQKLNQLHQNDRKNVIMKTAGYTSGVMMLLSSAWHVYEKGLSYRHTKSDLTHRQAAKIEIQQEIEVIKKLTQTEHTAEMLAQKNQALGRAIKKIERAQRSVNIDRVGLGRGCFKSVGALALFALSYYSDEITDLYEKYFVERKQAYRQFLNQWQVQYNEASIIPLDSTATPAEKSMMYFVLDDADWFEALEEYREENQAGYFKLVKTAKKQMNQIIMQELASVHYRILGESSRMGMGGYQLQAADALSVKGARVQTPAPIFKKLGYHQD